MSALILATEGGYKDIAKILIERGVDIHATNEVSI